MTNIYLLYKSICKYILKKYISLLQMVHILTGLTLSKMYFCPVYHIYTYT